MEKLMDAMPYWLTSALSVVGTVVGVAAFALNIGRYSLERKRRRDALFDKRFEYYSRVKEIWLSTHECNGSDRRILDIEDWIEIAAESEFLFGDDIHGHLLSLADEHHSGSPFFPNEDFVSPFRPYLCLR